MTCQNVSRGEESKTQVLMRVIRCWPQSRQQIAGIAQKRKQALAPCWACLVRITVDNKKKKKNVRQMLHWFSKIIKLPVIVFSILIFCKDLSGFARRLAENKKKQTVTSLLYSSPPQFEASQWTEMEEPCYAKPSDSCLTEYNHPSEKKHEGCCQEQ